MPKRDIVQKRRQELYSLRFYRAVARLDAHEPGRLKIWLLDITTSSVAGKMVTQMMYASRSELGPKVIDFPARSRPYRAL